MESKIFQRLGAKKEVKHMNKTAGALLPLTGLRTDVPPNPSKHPESSVGG